MRKITLAFLLVGCLSTQISAQLDIHFSQFYAAPLTLNPAMTGVMNCQQRIGVNYRNQWASVLRDKAFQTVNAEFDGKATVGRYDYFGYGLDLFTDQAGSLNFRNSDINGSFSYAKRMGGYRDRASYLVAGARVGLANHAVNIQDAHWGSQNDAGSFNPNLPSGEPSFGRDNFLFLDISAGVMWFSVFDANNNFFIGAAYDHLNRPNVSFTGGALAVTKPLDSKITIHAGGEFKTNDRISLLPGIVTFFQGKSMEVNGGTSVRFLMGSSKRSNEALQFGAWTRIANRFDSGVLVDAIILSTRFDYNDTSIGFSYDINMSQLKAASNGNGGFEFSLIYKFCGRESRDVYCPNF